MYTILISPLQTFSCSNFLFDLFDKSKNVSFILKNPKSNRKLSKITTKILQFRKFYQPNLQLQYYFWSIRNTYIVIYQIKISHSFRFSLKGV